MYYCWSHETLPHNGFQSFNMNNCYYHQDLYLRTLPSCLRSEVWHDSKHPPTYKVNTTRKTRIGHMLQRNPFSGLSHSVGELLHIP